MDDTPALLVVDDEPHILSALRRVLRREGWEILTAETAGEALSILDARSVDAILCDHQMPGMGGLELLGEAARRRPDTTRLLITGWGEELPRDRLEALSVHGLIPKPWDDAELRKRLRAALEPATATP